MKKSDAIKKFKQAFERKFGKNSCSFHYQEKDDGEKQIEMISVSVNVAKIDWDKVEPIVEGLLAASGASRYFEIGGAGLGFGWRDVSIYRK